MPATVKVGGAWKATTGVSVKVNGQWRLASAAFVNVGGTWKQWFASKITDTFTRSTTASGLGNSETGQAWNNLIGNWRVSGSNQALADGSSAELASVNFGSTDVTVKAEVSVGTGPAFWITDAGSWWASYVHSSQTSVQENYTDTCTSCYSAGCNSCTVAGAFTGCSSGCYSTSYTTVYTRTGPADSAYCCNSGGSLNGSYNTCYVAAQYIGSTFQAAYTYQASYCGTCGTSGGVPGYTIGQATYTCYSSSQKATNTYYAPSAAPCNCNAGDGGSSTASYGTGSSYTPTYPGCSCTSGGSGGGSYPGGCNNYSCTKTRTIVTNYYYLRLVNSTGGVVSQATGQVTLNSAAAAIAVTTLGNTITVQAYSDTAYTNQLGTTITHTPASPVKGTSVGIIKQITDANQGNTLDNFSATI